MRYRGGVSASRASFGPRSSLHNWLAPADLPRQANLIFVLAGRVVRKEYGFELLRQGLAKQILLSVGRFEIRRFSQMPLPVPLDLLKLAQTVPPPERHYFVHFHDGSVEVQHIRPGRFGTLTEIRALAGWLAQHPEMRSVLVISNGAHLRRIRLCCRALLPRNWELAFVGTPAKTEDTSARSSFLDDLEELGKLSVYSILLKLRAR